MVEDPIFKVGFERMKDGECEGEMKCGCPERYDEKTFILTHLLYELRLKRLPRSTRIVM